MNKIKLYLKLIGEDILKMLKWLTWAMLEVFTVLFFGILFFKATMNPNVYKMLKIIISGIFISLIFLALSICIVYVWLNISFYIEDLNSRATNKK